MKKLLFPLLTIAFAAVAPACKKGCTDPVATNYAEENKRDDGSCKYEARVVFWHTTETSYDLDSAYVTLEDFYVDGQAITGYWGSYIDPSAYAPDCKTSLWSVDYYNNPVGIIDMAGNKSKTITYEVLDYEDNIVFTGTRTLFANTCHPIELKF